MKRPSSLSVWYREPWAWLLIGVMSVALALTLGMVAIAVRHSDALVTDHYYQAGLGVGQSLERERLAAKLGLDAQLTLEGSRIDIKLEALNLAPQDLPPTLQLNLISPTQAGQDRQLILVRDGDGYRGVLNAPSGGRRIIELLGLTRAQQTWRLMTEHNMTPPQAFRLTATPTAAE